MFNEYHIRPTQREDPPDRRGDHARELPLRDAGLVVSSLPLLLRSSTYPR